MSKLIYAGLMRLRKNWLFWGILAALAGLSLYICVIERRMTFYLEWLLLDMTPYMSFIGAGFIGLFVGTEYSDGAMRNKLVVGHTRAAVYGANLAVSALACVLFQLVFFAVICTVGQMYMGWQYRVSTAAFYMLCELLVCVAFAALFTAVVMCCSNKAGAIVASFCVAFLLVFVSAQINDRLVEPETITNGPLYITQEGSLAIDPVEVYDNPLYIPEGPVRTVLETVNSILPTGQTVVLNDMYGSWKETEPTVMEHWEWPLCSIIFTLLATAIGLQIFMRKDIK